MTVEQLYLGQMNLYKLFLMTAFITSAGMYFMHAQN